MWKRDSIDSIRVLQVINETYNVTTIEPLIFHEVLKFLYREYHTKYRTTKNLRPSKNIVNVQNLFINKPSLSILKNFYYETLK